MNHTTNLFKSFIIVGAMIVISPAYASFEGYYDVSNWQTTITPGSDASIDLNNAPNSITLTGGNNAIDPEELFATIDFTISADATGMLSFNWSYETTDESAEWDPLSFLHNGTEYALSADGGSLTQSGVFDFNVQLGDIFGFRQASLDSLFGSAESTISNFSAPVPLPGALVLFGIALASLNVFRRNRAE